MSSLQGVTNQQPDARIYSAVNSAGGQLPAADDYIFLVWTCLATFDVALKDTNYHLAKSSAFQSRYRSTDLFEVLPLNEAELKGENKELRQSIRLFKVLV